MENGPEMVVLDRPDGHVAWRGEGASDQEASGDGTDHATIVLSLVLEHPVLA